MIRVWKRVNKMEKSNFKPHAIDVFKDTNNKELKNKLRELCNQLDIDEIGYAITYLYTVYTRKAFEEMKSKQT